MLNSNLYDAELEHGLEAIVSWASSMPKKGINSSISNNDVKFNSNDRNINEDSVQIKTLCS